MRLEKIWIHFRPDREGSSLRRGCLAAQSAQGLSSCSGAVTVVGGVNEHLVDDPKLLEMRNNLPLATDCTITGQNGDVSGGSPRSQHRSELAREPLDGRGPG